MGTGGLFFATATYVSFAVTRTLYENLWIGVLNECEYKELRNNYQEERESLMQRATELKQKLEDAKHRTASLKESLHILNELTDAAMPTKEHVEQFVERVEVFRDGRVYVGFSYL